jgi:hypothetical protein
MVILPNVLEILGSRFKEKIKSSNNLNSTKKCYPIYFYDEKGASCSVIKNEVCSYWFSYFNIPSEV